MIKAGIPLTRDNYILMNWGPDAPRDLGEGEEQIPPFLRHPDHMGDDE